MYDGCGWGTFGMFNVDNDYDIKQNVAQYFAAQLLTQEWAQPVDQLHAIYPARTDIRDGEGRQRVTVYAIFRPDHQWAVLLVNKDHASTHSVSVRFKDWSRNTAHYFQGSVRQVSFGAENYTWHADGANGYANPDGPAVVSTQVGGRREEYVLPPASITVLRGVVQ
jgi:hypothetical protein